MRKLLVSYPKSSKPVVSTITGGIINALQLANVEFRPANEDTSIQVNEDGQSSVGFVSDLSCSMYLAMTFPSTGLFPSTEPKMASWLEWSNLTQVTPQAVSSLDTYLALRTYLIGHQLTLSDICVWSTLAKLKTPTTGNVKRWFEHLSGAQHFAASGLIESKSAPSDKPKKRDEANMEGKLIGAEMGKVVTRFPPEPSGYLHIGHCKALIINESFARAYQGKLILRFDDTNPCKEKMEFEEAMLEDIGKLGIKPDQVTYTSDSFGKMEEFAHQLIKDGLAYVDDTPVDEMRDQRGKGVENASRSRSVEENQKLFAEMLKGTELGQKCCLRAKIDMAHKNKCMRDPVFYRCIVDTPHHRFGFQYKAYPTYDFACPIVDSIEGVTHACRTIEYADRNEQFQWVIEALKLRPVSIYEFSKTNFVHTVLSKRKLTWFVENGVVPGWDDPRFPTIRGVLRRGLTIDALRDFVLTQGASRATNLMEWDKIWSINKQKIDPIVPRYAAVDAKSHVILELSDGPATETGHLDLLHPKNPELGKKLVLTYKRIMLEFDDAKNIEAGEEITLIHWGNMIVERIEGSGEGIKLFGRTHLQGNVKDTKKKLHWVPQLDESRLTKVTLREYDHLITKSKLEETDDFQQYINPQSIYDTPALGDPALKTLQRGDKLQLERRGYYIVDEPAQPKNDFTPVLVYIPDGKTKAMSNITGKVDLATLAGRAK